MAEIVVQPSPINKALAEMATVAHQKNNPAGYAQQRLLKHIADYERVISSDHEVCVDLVGSNVPPFHLRSIQASNPDILVFSGLDDAGQPVVLMQHHSQLSIFLSSVSKLQEKPFRVGFVPAAG